MTNGSTQQPRRRAPRARPGRATIREIAAEAGVSTATVSRYLNAPELVTEKTKAVISAVIDEHHYISDGMAGGLASRRSRLIGVIIPTIANSIYALSTQAVQHTAQAEGYTVMVGVTDFDPEQERQLIHKLLERRVDGLILTGVARDDRLYETIRRNGVPFAITWKFAAGSAFPCISFDNHKAAAKAVDHLISLGHQRIGLICGRTALNDRAEGRRAGFEAAIARAGQPASPDLIHEGDFEFVEGRRAMARMLALAEPPTAVFCANDIQAIGALYECRDAGLDVPRDVSIIGFDDLPISQYVEPQLTTIRVPAADMGRRATEAILQAITVEHEVEREELSTELVLRGSTATLH